MTALTLIYAFGFAATVWALLYRTWNVNARYVVAVLLVAVFWPTVLVTAAVMILASALGGER